MKRRLIGTVFLGAAAAVLASGCGRGDGFVVPGGLAGAINGGPGGGTGGSGSQASSGASTGVSGSGASTGTPGGTGIGGRTSGGATGNSGSSGTGGTTGGQACQTLDDCPDLETICSGGTCQLNFCGASSTPGHQNGELDGTCDVQASNDGSCIPQDLDGKPVGLCSQGGPADGGCDPAATRPQGLGGACEAGDVCLVQPGGAQCFLLCDPIPSKQSTCPPEDACVRPLLSNTRLGVCEPAGATSGTGTGGATGGSGGATSGGTTGDCNPDIESKELQNCEAGQCGCPFTCVADPVTAGKICEYQNCNQDPCPDPLTVCDAATGFCNLVACGPGTGNGSFNSTCTMPDGSAGTCAPLTLDGINSVGLCQLAGTATTDCDPMPVRTDPPSKLCLPGSLCFGGFGHADGTCNALCTPSTGSGCPEGQHCSVIVDEPDLGICTDQF